MRNPTERKMFPNGNCHSGKCPSPERCLNTSYRKLSGAHLQQFHFIQSKKLLISTALKSNDQEHLCKSSETKKVFLKCWVLKWTSFQKSNFCAEFQNWTTFLERLLRNENSTSYFCHPQILLLRKFNHAEATIDSKLTHKVIK